MFRTITAITTGVLLAARIGCAETAAPPLQLADVIAEARQRNPQIQSARQRSTASAAVPAQVSAYDDPMVTYEAWNSPDWFNSPDNNIVKLSQKVPFPGKRTLAGNIAEGTAEMARRDAQSVELDVIAMVRRAYYDLWMSHENRLIYARDQELVQRFARIAEAKYTVGQVSQPDVLRAQVEVTRLINRVTTATLAIESARAELNALLSRPPEEPLGIPEEPQRLRLAESPEALVRTALAQRPELAAQAAVIKGDEAGVRLARLNYFPDFEFTGERFFNSGQRDGLGAIVSLSIPFVHASKYAAAGDEANARLAAAQADLRQLQDRIRREVQQAYLRARAALEQHELFVTTHIPQAEQALQATEIGYQTGKVDFLSLIDSVRAIESVHIEHIQAAADFEKAFADLERAVGADLPRTDAAAGE